MLSMALAQHKGFMNTVAAVPSPRGLALECHSISWHCIHYLLEWKNLLHIQTCMCCCRGDVMSCSLRTAHSPQDCETPSLLEPMVPTGEHSAALHCLCCLEKGSVYFESQMSSLLCSRTMSISRWTVRVWHLLETEPSVKCNLQLIGIALHYR